AVMRTACCDELRRLLFRGRVAEEVPAADLRPGEVLEQVRSAQRRMEFDVEMEPFDASIERGLMERHHIWKWHLPEIVETNSHVAEDCREIPPFVVFQRRDGFYAPQWRDVRFVGVSREVGNERNRAAVTGEDAPAVLALGGQNVLEEGSAR